MKLEEKTKKKDEQGLIIKKYQQYLKLEKSLSKNTLEAYLTVVSTPVHRHVSFQVLNPFSTF